MIDTVLAFLDATDAVAQGAGTVPNGTVPNGSAAVGTGAAADRSRLLPPQAWRALRYTIARLAVDLVSGPAGIAAALRQGLLDAPYAGKSIPLDVGVSASVPGAIRRAVQLRARHCEWPGCDKPPAWCDVHHLVHQADGGRTSIQNCVLLCQYHHDICIHRQGWRLVLHPDGTTTAHGPKGQVLQSHGTAGNADPPGSGPSGSGPSGSGPPHDQAA